MSGVRHKLQDLNQLFSEGETADKEIFSEQRSNVQLVAGEHYMKKGSKFWNRVRDSKDVTTDQKIRLTKNHTGKISKIWKNAITSYAPGVQAGPKDKSSPQHQKTSELVNAVWANAKQNHNLNYKISQWAGDFTDIGEVGVKLYFDPSKGKFLGYEAEMDEMGQMQVDEMGQPIASERAKFAGDVVFERVFGFNLIRPAGCKDLEEAPWLAIRKMVGIDELKSLIDLSTTMDDEEKQSTKSKISQTPDQTFLVMDHGTQSYKQVKDQTLLKEFYFRPCVDYPQGYFYITVDSAILFDGELPFGIYPIIFQGFDEIQTSPRFRSIIKQLRPYQVEINRCASTIAEHQITLGWDKILVQNGTKLQPGTAFPGVRSYTYQGMQPVVLEGRTGNQYLDYMNAQISEMYQIAMVDENYVEKTENYDVFSMLARSIKDKKKFSLYTDKFEHFLKNVFVTYVKLAQHYFSDVHLIPALGKSEYVNINEFKNVSDLCYSVIAEPQTDDSETKLGKQLMLNHIIQYVGPQLQKDDIGKLIKLMPYANEDQILEDLTMDYDYTTNCILKLDRGQQVQPNPYVQSIPYVIQRLRNRMNKPDFDFYGPQIKQVYEITIGQYEQIKAEQEMKIKQAQSEFIPSGGFLVACDFYVPDPANPEKLPKRVRLPSEALDWLVKQLNSQGSDQQTLQNLNQGSLADLSTRIIGQGQQQGAPHPGGFYGFQ